jgi:hypothetical protein
VATRGYVFHEVTHFFQYTAIGRNVQNGPCWFDEGQADYVQAAQSAANSADAFPIALQSRYDERFLINKYFNFKPTADGLYKILSEEVSGSKLCIDETPYFGYTMGSMVSEKIVIDFGWKNYLLLMDNLNKSDWNEAFFKTTGRQLDDWYKSDLVPYLLKILAEKD